MGKTLQIVCQTPGCTNLGREINAVEFEEGREDLIELFVANYGTGCEDSEDFCQECGVLGVLGDSET